MSHLTSHCRNTSPGLATSWCGTSGGRSSSATVLLLAGQVICGLAGCRTIDLRADAQSSPPSVAVAPAGVQQFGSRGFPGALAAMQTARQQYFAGHPELALEQLTRARQLDSRPDTLLPVLELTARIQFDRGDRAAAQASLQELVLAAGGRADWLNLAGRSLLHAGAPATAVAPLRQAVALRPRESRFSRDLAVALLQLEQPGQAGEFLARAARLAPHDADLAAVERRVRDQLRRSASEPSAVQVAGYFETVEAESHGPSHVRSHTEPLLPGDPESVSAESETAGATNARAEVASRGSSPAAPALPVITPRRRYRAEAVTPPRFPDERPVVSPPSVVQLPSVVQPLPVVQSRSAAKPLADGHSLPVIAPRRRVPRAFAARAGFVDPPANPGLNNTPTDTRPEPAAERKQPDRSRTRQVPRTLPAPPSAVKPGTRAASPSENGEGEAALPPAVWHRRARRRPVEAPKPAVHWFPPRAKAAAPATAPQ